MPNLHQRLSLLLQLLLLQMQKLTKVTFYNSIYSNSRLLSKKIRQEWRDRNKIIRENVVEESY
jgi:hypothetical protein